MMAQVMIIEDDNTIRMMYVAGLQAMGLTVTEARDLKTARRFFDEGEVPRVVLLDLRLPGESGEQIIPFIRQHLPEDNVKIIVASAFDDRRDEVLAMGADIFVVKPVDLAVLLQTVQQYTM